MMHMCINVKDRVKRPTVFQNVNASLSKTKTQEDSNAEV